MHSASSGFESVREGIQQASSAESIRLTARPERIRHAAQAALSVRPVRPLRPAHPLRADDRPRPLSSEHHILPALSSFHINFSVCVRSFLVSIIIIFFRALADRISTPELLSEHFYALSPSLTLLRPPLHTEDHLNSDEETAPSAHPLSRPALKLTLCRCLPRFECIGMPSKSPFEPSGRCISVDYSAVLALLGRCT